MKVFVTGANGQLGFDVINELKKRGHTPIGSDLAEKDDENYYSLDITNEDKVREVLTSVSPDVVVHCAAWTAADAAEDEENRDKVYAVNVTGSENLAKVCGELDCKMVYISTDYVFNGEGTEPWDADSMPSSPLNVYGQTKLKGEQAVAKFVKKHFVVRIAWVFGINGNNFVKTMINLSKKLDTLRVVNDQIGTPTYTYDLSILLVDMIESEKYGYYHATNEGGFVSWYEFACEILKRVGATTNVIPVTTEEYGLSKAKRPFNSRLDKSKLANNGFNLLPTWQDALDRYLKEIDY